MLVKNCSVSVNYSILRNHMGKCFPSPCKLFPILQNIVTVGWGEYCGGEVRTLLSQEQDVMEKNVTS